MRRWTVAVAALALLALGCSEEGAPSATTAGPATTTTLPPPSTATTLAGASVADLDACRLLRQRQLELVLEDPGEGEAGDPVAAPLPDGSTPALITASCSWPSIDDPAIELDYLAPTTAPDGPSHLQDVLETGTGFADGGRVVSEAVGAETVGVLLDADEHVRELAVVHGSALVYLVVNQDVSARDLEAFQALKDMVVTALARAPR